MLDPLTWIAMAGAVAARTVAGVCFTKAAQRTGRSLVAYFVLGNVFGVSYPICTTLALQGNNPNLVFGTMAGMGGIFFVLVIDRLFKDSLSLRQWMAILMILAATVVLQLPPENTPASPGREPSKQTNIGLPEKE